MPSFEPVRAIQRGLSVLRAVSEHGPVTVSDIVALCAVPQPTAVRMLETLLSEGYIYRQPGKATYKVTGRALALSRGFDSRSRLLELAAPVVDQMHVKIGWPSNLAVFDRDAMVIVYSNRASLGLSVPGRMGARLPMLATGVGLVTLAYMPEGERQPALQQAKAGGAHWDAAPRLAAGLPDRLERIRRDGHAFADEEYLRTIYQSRIWAVAVPILDGNGQVQAALSSLVLRIAGERKRLLGMILPNLTAAALRISELMDRERL
ncbi:IclR family transcriptional regulator [Azospirillum doebereinerae]